MKAGQTLWTREELILAFNLYLKLPFGKLHKTNPEVMRLAALIGRNSNAVAIRLTNFASIDPYHQNRGIKGMPGGAKQCQPIWDEFVNNKEELLFESERILADRQHLSLEEKYPELLQDVSALKGESKLRLVKTRVNQNVFRQIVVVNYSTRCAISGIDIPELLVASHIVPWSANEAERLNPANGICLSPLYDRAFDRGLISINERYEVIVSTELKKNINKEYFSNLFAPIDKCKIELPTKYVPHKSFLQFHLDTIFRK